MLTKENKKTLKELLDNLIDWSGVKEVISDLAINIGVDQFDKQVLDRFLKPEHEERVNEVCDAIEDKAYDQAIILLDGILNDMIDIPWFKGEAENKFVEGLLLILQATVLQLQNNAGAPEEELPGESD